ncbi:CATRA system-associated protein [Saccharothrix sp. NRRL B-16348]|uniref:CATRA system-associated protein n=1 Tax=Saccharothrix sp. NRRL B-16348 TaxID=1415542 RepID=UPI000AECA8D4|nr:CATRA system-associated protein [Saccharothrix sp. NRRL B-16348]
MTVTAYPELGAAVVADAVAVLADLPGWRLDEARWTTVAEAVAELSEAVRDRDPDAFGAAAVDLELAVPRRITRIGDEPVVPPPARVLELANELVRTLVGDTGDRYRAQEPAGEDRPGDRRAG